MKKKLLIEYGGPEKSVSAKIVTENMIPENYLPTSGEYMDAEEDEFKEEIQTFSSRIRNYKFEIQPKVKLLWFIEPCKKTVALTDEYYNSIFDTKGLVTFSSKCQINAIYV